MLWQTKFWAPDAPLLIYLPAIAPGKAAEYGLTALASVRMCETQKQLLLSTYGCLEVENQQVEDSVPYYLQLCLSNISNLKNINKDKYKHVGEKSEHLPAEIFFIQIPKSRKQKILIISLFVIAHIIEYCYS